MIARLYRTTVRYIFKNTIRESVQLEVNRYRAGGSCRTVEFATESNLMKRTRAATKIQEQQTTSERKRDDNDVETEIQATSKETEKTNLRNSYFYKNNSSSLFYTKSKEITSNERPKLNLKSLKNGNIKNKHNPHITLPKKSKNIEEKETFIDEEGEELKPTTAPNKGKLRAVVDMQMIKEELKQLEDPPVTPWEKEMSADRLQYEFFNIPCEDLAQKLLGKVLVRRLDNGTILKGRIVETEAYLGTIDKAAQSYQNKITPRNLPMYMPPGTVYVYMTYGMYHCFNISSQEMNAYVLIRAMEPLMGLDCMELQANTRYKDNAREKQIAMRLKQHELCNNPFKICDAFAIDREAFNQKLVYTCSSLWLEKQSFVRSPTIVAVPPKDHDTNDNYLKQTRYYILGSTSVSETNSTCDGCAVLVRALDPLEGIEHMADQRKLSEAKKASLKQHELCNGPSKLCMAYQLNRQHSKYSVCTWKSLWLEDDGMLSNLQIIKSTRIGIDSSGPEWANKLLRYYVYGNKSVSKKDKKAEKNIS